MVVRVTFRTPHPSLSLPWHFSVLEADTEEAAKAAVANHISNLVEFELEIVPQK